eukprot:3090567-Pyramimonas_sp.AAC.1
MHALTKPARSADDPLSAVSWWSVSSWDQDSLNVALTLPQIFGATVTVPNALSPPVGFAANAHLVAERCLGHAQFSSAYWMRPRSCSRAGSGTRRMAPGPRGVKTQGLRVTHPVDHFVNALQREVRQFLLQRLLRELVEEFL